MCAVARLVPTDMMEAAVVKYKYVDLLVSRLATMESHDPQCMTLRHGRNHNDFHNNPTLEIICAATSSNAIELMCKKVIACHDRILIYVLVGFA